MSIYSGFATRAQQQNYDNLIQDLIYVLQKRIMKFYKREETDEEKFLAILSQIYSQMHTMEKNKYLEPKTSESIIDLLTFMQTECKKIMKQKEHQQELSIQPKPSTAISHHHMSTPTENHIVSRFDPNSSTKLNNRESLSISKDNEKSFGCIRHQFKIRTERKNPFILNPQQPDQVETQNDGDKSNAGESRDQRPRTQSQRRKAYSSNIPPNKDVNQILDDYINRTKKNYLRGYRKKQNAFISRTFVLGNKKPQE